tara:strand:- start:187 stop:459 length:273 start_codon:yes stop_codon:yes gene_type:complete
MEIQKVCLSFFLFLVPLGGCATNDATSLSEAEIENICKKKKLEASKPMTNVSLATGSEGPKYEIGITMSSDFIAGRDPEEVYKDCKLSLS